MSNRFSKAVLVSLTALAISAVGTASARPPAGNPDHGAKAEKPGRGQSGADQTGTGENGRGPVGKGRQYNFHGTYIGAEGLAAGQISVSVEKGNRAVRRSGLIGQTVVFDLSAARIKVADVNSDGNSDLADLQIGDTVKIKARIPVGAVITQPVTAWKLIDATNPPADLSPENGTLG